MNRWLLWPLLALLVGCGGGQEEGFEIPKVTEFRTPQTIYSPEPLDPAPPTPPLSDLKVVDLDPTQIILTIRDAKKLIEILAHKDLFFAEGEIDTLQALFSKTSLNPTICQLVVANPEVDHLALEDDVDWRATLIVDGVKDNVRTIFLNFLPTTCLVCSKYSRDAFTVQEIQTALRGLADLTITPTPRSPKVKKNPKFNIHEKREASL